MVAALPLVNRRLKLLLNMGGLPCDCWFPGGSLLLDPSPEAPAALDCLLSAFARLPWPLVRLDPVPFDDPLWESFRAAASRAKLSLSMREHYRIGQVEIGDDWDAYKSRMKGDQRRNLNRYVRRLQEAGGAELRIYRQMTPDQVDELVRRAFEVEDRSWKGAEGTSVLRNPTVFEQYRREAQLLAKWRQLVLAFLELRGEPIAFVYGWFAKGVFHTVKLGYAEAYAEFAPGQQLLLRLLEHLHADRDVHLLDFAGPLADFHKLWITRSYPVGSLVVATPRLLGRGLFHAYHHWQPRLKRLQHFLAGSPAPEPAGAIDVGVS
ncbi:MAG: GNAT family N-acetyltransferase [Planctomycetes bacterium]|nr:GNAT family N-acetyltransferase [Planctomycetota bacterium]